MNDNPATIAESFAIWIESIPAEPPFYTRADFAPFADMTDDQMAQADEIIASRVKAVTAEAGELRRLAGLVNHD